MRTSSRPDQRPTSEPLSFRPEHCPYPECPDHLVTDRSYRSVRCGFYSRLAEPHTIPRRRCRTCRRTFSSQTFSPTYFLKRPENLLPVARQLVNAGCDRHVRRTMRSNPRYAPKPNAGAAGSTVTRLIPRLAREAALFLAELEEIAAARPSAREPVALDDFETFAVTQLHQVSVPTVVGRETSYIYQIDQAPHRRGGKLTPAQRTAERKLLRAGRLPSPDARRKAWRRVIDALLETTPPGRTLDCVSDGDKTLGAVLAEAGPRVRHRAFPNPQRGPKGSPRSQEARVRDRAMREVDHLHRWLRHSIAHDRRETIAFARDVNALLGRRLMFAVARNAIQARRERDPDSGTPAMARGILDRPLSWDEILERRRFPRRIRALPPGWATCYSEEIPTLGKKPSRRRFPSFAR